ncbi:cobalt/nickel transport system permease protein [Desulfobaculum xiamenense]|uniref:Cobalt/nickel transport system permease protein n=1 Tax=Desulfobaculum xiamenense TaxID=995050 RepID=A0A846QJ74_9BACT|nr:cobalt ECF transporter T component CbiQ [Desulfobaculum xiamenense]NJB67120.1 cobalt/nickel transport system permease protein [Desulfobaculum xiamenense]
MLDEHFAYGTSPVHALDPRVKITAATAFSVVVAVSQHPHTLYAALAVSVALLAAARLDARPVLRRLLGVNAFIAFLWLFIPFSVPGEAVLSVWKLVASREGLELAGLITLKSNAIVIAFTALIATTPVPDLGHALRKLHVPDKLGWLLIFTYRHIFLIAQEYQRLNAAMKVRGFRPRTDLHTYRSYASLIGMVLVRSWDRSERVYQAMLCRGFNGTFHSLNGFAHSTRDILFLASMLAVTCALAAGEIILP